MSTTNCLSMEHRIRVRFAGDEAITELTTEEFGALPPERLRGMVLNPWTAEMEARHRLLAARWREDHAGELPAFLLDHLPEIAHMDAVLEWLATPQPTLDFRTPQSLIDARDFDPLVAVVRRVLGGVCC